MELALRGFFFAALSLNVKCLSDVAHETLHILQQYNYVQLNLALVNFHYSGLSLRIRKAQFAQCIATFQDILKVAKSAFTT